VLRCVAVCYSQMGPYTYTNTCCSVLQCAAVRYSVLQRVAACCSVLQSNGSLYRHTHWGVCFGFSAQPFVNVAVCCSVLQCVAVCCSVLQCAAVCCSVLQCVAVCCSVGFSA